jgi:hypothetical protein
LDKIGLKRRNLKKILPEKLWKLGKKIAYKKQKIKIPEETKKELSKRLKSEIKKTDKLLHEKGFLSKNRDLIRKWNYKTI